LGDRRNGTDHDAQAAELVVGNNELRGWRFEGFTASLYLQGAALEPSGKLKEESSCKGLRKRARNVQGHTVFQRICRSLFVRWGSGMGAG